MVLDVLMALATYDEGMDCTLCSHVQKKDVTSMAWLSVPTVICDDWK
jgi:hypothetical protein